MQKQNSISLSGEQMLLQESSAKFFARECPLERAKELLAANTAYDQPLWIKMAQQGVLGLLLPESIGGLASGLVELSILAEEMGKACLPGPFNANLWGSCLVQRSGSGARQEQLLADVCTGRIKLSVATKGTDQDVHFKLDLNPGQDYVLNGRSSPVVDAERSDYLIIAAIDAGGETILLMIDSDTAAVTLTRIPSLDQMRPQFSLHCHNVVVGREDILARGDAAESALSYARAVAGIAATADIIGTMQWVLQTALDFNNDRQKLGQVIRSFRDLPERCEDLLSSVANNRLAVYCAAAALQQGKAEAGRAVTLARDGTAETATKLAELLIQRQQGMGLTFEHDLHLFRSVPPFFESIS